MSEINLLVVPINDSEVDFEEIKKEFGGTEFVENMFFNFSESDKTVEIPSETDRAAPWHVCPVSEEIQDISSARCYSFDYCLMYVIDEVEKLLEKNSDIDFVVFLFSKKPTRDGNLYSLSERFVCVKNDFENFRDGLSLLTSGIKERDEF